MSKIFEFSIGIFIIVDTLIRHIKLIYVSNLSWIYIQIIILFYIIFYICGISMIISAIKDFKRS